jgi:hypothetical protein
MKYTASKAEGKEEPYDYRNDFKVLTIGEKRAVLKTAKHLLKLQKENALLTDVPALPMETEKGLG